MIFLTLLRETATRVAAQCDAVRQLALLAVLLAALSAASAAPLPAGKGEITLDVRGTPITVYTYRPAGYAGRGLLLTLHGVGRNAAGYRDHAVPLAERHGLLVAAPLFDRRRFPTSRFQWGGIARAPRDASAATLEIEPEERWLGHLVVALVDAIRAVESGPAMPFYLLGHSGGAQALSRIAATTETGARRIVLANAGTYLWPTREVRFPDGYGGLPAQWASDEHLRRYLAQPLTLLLGTADVVQDAELSMRPTASAQGANRWERGHNAFRAAQRLAQSRGWAFNWTLVEVPGIGHSARGMFAAEAAAAALEP